MARYRPGVATAQVFEQLDERFGACVNPSAALHVLHTGCEWAEGPVWVPAGRYLLWSDIPRDAVLRWDEATGVVTTVASPAGHPNGHVLDERGRVVTCEHGGRRVVRTEHDGSVTVLAEHHRGARLNSPNDVVVRSDGTVFFTDPTYGIDSDYEGHRAPSEVGASRVYRVGVTSAGPGSVEVAAEGFVQPNGVALSLDERRLYVSDTGSGSDTATGTGDGPPHLRVLDVAPDGALSGGGVFAASTAGVFDGFRLDADGRVWTSAGDGVHCYDPDGTLLGKVLVPETVSNLDFGGARRNRLLITATSSVYAVRLRVRGAPLACTPRDGGAP